MGRDRSVVSRRLRPLLYELKTVVAQYPSLALPLARWRGHGYPFGPGTEILIEGFPRSGTSFAVSAFEMAQPRKPVVAHHVHSPSQVIAAVRANVPALVLIRAPREAVVSFLIRYPGLSFAHALRGYRRFYAPLLPYRDRFVTAPFHDVVGDFGKVISAVNLKFGTNFHLFEHTEENVRRCLQAIDDYTRPTVKTEDELERIVARPSAGRERFREALREGYGGSELRALRAAASDLYRAFVDPAP